MDPVCNYVGTWWSRERQREAITYFDSTVTLKSPTFWAVKEARERSRLQWRILTCAGPLHIGLPTTTTRAIRFKWVVHIPGANYTQGHHRSAVHGGPNWL